jgi:amino acid permease
MIEQDTANKLDTLGGQCSNGKAVVNVILTAIGVGIVYLPIVMGKCGWIGGSLVLFTSAIITIYSTWLLYYAITKNPHGFKDSFTSLAESLFGTGMKWFTAVTINGTLILICAVLLILIGQSIERAADMKSEHAWRYFALGAGLLAMPLTWLKTMNEVGIVSSIGVVTLIAFIGVVVTAALISLSKTGLQATSTYLVSAKQSQTSMEYFENFLSSVAVSFVSYFMSSCVPTLIKDMRKPESFPTVSKLGNGSVFIIYLILCLSCYAAWGTGNNSKDGILKIMGSNGMGDMSKIADVLLVLTGIPHFIALILPTSVAVDPIFEKFNKKIPCAYIVGRSLVVLVIIGIALIDKDAMKLVEIMGSITTVILSIFLPVSFYVKVKSLRAEPIRIGEMVALCGLVVFGLTVMIASLSFKFLKST